MAAPKPKIRILMLHGFAQSGPSFQVKTRPLTKMLCKTISDCYHVMAEDVKLVIPTAPLQLRASDRCGAYAEGQQFLDDSDTWAWWQNLDTTSQYVGIESSLAALILLVQKDGPFTGAVGFSQGATLAVMFASWCESGSVPGRSEALRDMSDHNAPLSQLLSSPPQRQLDFALCFSGFRGTPSFYGGFYAPKVVTPTVHILGQLDNMVSNADSKDLIDSCFEPKVLQHQGVHFVPRHVDVLSQISKYLENIITKAAAPTSLLLNSEQHCPTVPPGKDIILADTKSSRSLEAGNDTNWRSRLRRTNSPRIVRRYQLSGSRADAERMRKKPRRAYREWQAQQEAREEGAGQELRRSKRSRVPRKRRNGEL
jgi:hypothetical protein